MTCEPSSLTDEIIDFCKRHATGYGSISKLANAYISLHQRLTAAQTQTSADLERVCQFMLNHGYATGHGDSIEDCLSELDWQEKERWDKLEAQARMSQLLPIKNEQVVVQIVGGCDRGIDCGWMNSTGFCSKEDCERLRARGRSP